MRKTDKPASPVLMAAERGHVIMARRVSRRDAAQDVAVAVACLSLLVLAASFMLIW
jgi:hypothetical protein